MTIRYHCPAKMATRSTRRKDAAENSSSAATGRSAGSYLQCRFKPACHRAKGAERHLLTLCGGRYNAPFAGSVDLSLISVRVIGYGNRYQVKASSLTNGTRPQVLEVITNLADVIADVGANLNLTLLKLGSDSPLQPVRATIHTVLRCLNRI